MSSPVRWWEKSAAATGYSKADADALRATDCVDECAAVENRQRAWHEMGLWNATLLTNREQPGFNWGTGAPRVQELTPANLTTENFVLMGGEVMLARAMSSPLQPTAVPVGSSFETRRIVRKLNRWCRGVWRQLECERKCAQSFLDMYTNGKGVVRADYNKQSGKLEVSSVFFNNYIVDNTESANRAEPLTHRIRMMVPRRIVESAYKVVLKPDEGRNYADYRRHSADYVPVVEAWRLPGCDGKGGWHMVATPGHILKEEPWTDPESGVVTGDWAGPGNVTGTLGRSGVELAIPYQLRQNELSEVIRDAQDYCCRPRLLVHAGSKFDQQAADNVAARIWQYTGVKPEAFSWTTAINDLYAERERNGNAFLRFFGTSAMTSQAVLPAGVRLDSSAAVREARAMEDQRFLPLWIEYERMRIGLMRLMIRTMARSGGDHATTVRLSGIRTETIRWSEVSDILEDEHYTWGVEPLPASRESPAIHRQVLEDRFATGRTDRSYDKEFVDPPDVRAIEAAEAAGCRHVDWLIEEYEEGRWHQPDPIMNLVYFIPRVQANYLELSQLEGDGSQGQKELATAMTLHRQGLRAALAIVNPVTQPPSAGPLLATPNTAGIMPPPLGGSPMPGPPMPAMGGRPLG